MKNIGILLILLSIVGCVDQDSKTEDTVVVETKVEEIIEEMPAQVYEGSILENKEAFIKANDFYGYKGNVTVTVDRYEEGYAAEGGSTNIGVVYKAYLDFVSPENQKVIFYESEHAPELEINIVNNGALTFHETNTTSTVFYEKKKIYDSDMSSEEKNKVAENVPLYKYPYIFWDYIYYGGEPTSLQDLISPEKSAQSYIEDSEMDGYDPYDDYSFKVETDEKLRITGVYTGDNGDSFTWKNGVVHKKFIGIMGEGITIEFLDEKGWIRRSDNICIGQTSEDDITLGYAENGNLKELQNFMYCNPSTDIDKEYPGGWTLLMAASSGGHLDIVKYLREVKSASVNYSTSFYSHTALMAASENGHIEIAKYLVTEGALLDEWNKRGDTALMMASRGGHLEIVKYLVENGADIHVKGSEWKTALMLATEQKHIEIAQYLESIK